MSADNLLPREPSFYTVLRELRASGYTSCTTEDGRIMVTASEPLPDESLFAEKLGQLPDEIGFQRQRIDLAP